jgi:hypothetical protein
VDLDAAAHRWAETWRRAWPLKDIDAIVRLYSADATYSSLPFRKPGLGIDGVRSYLTRTFATESDIECWFGGPVVGDERAVVEWWATWIEDGQAITLAGTTVLSFDGDGLVVGHRDYWNQLNERRAPYPEW